MIIFTLKQIALWNKSTKLELFNRIGSRNNWGYEVRESQGKGDIQGRSIVYLMKKNNWKTIDLLKIDIEGSEKTTF